MPERNLISKSNTIESFFAAILPFLAFAVPVFFLPLTLEFYEFNKLNLIVLTTISLLIAWVVKMLMIKEVSIVKSKLDLPILAVLVTFIASTVFSLNKVSSIFGSHGRWFPSLFAMVMLISFYYVVSSNVSHVKTILNTLYALVAGITISTFVMMFRYFGISLGQATFVQAQNFNLSGSTIVATSMAALGALVGLALIAKAQSTISKAILTLTIIINAFLVMLIGSTPAIMAAVIGTVTLIVLTRGKYLNENKAFYSTILGSILLTAALLVAPATKEVLINKTYQKDVVLSPVESWRVASSTLRDFPILGTGPSTFYLNYPRYRSISQNNGQYWNVRFDKPHNEVFNLIGTMGIVGIAAFIFFVTKIVKVTFSKESREEESGVSAILSAATLATLTLFVFSPATVSTAFVLFLLLALNIAVLHRQAIQAERVVLSLGSVTQSMSLVGNMGISYKKETLQYFVSLPLLALAVIAGFHSYKNFLGEHYMRKSVQALVNNDGNNTYIYQTKAINVNPKRDVYRTSLARTNIILANSVASKKDLSDGDKETIRKLVTQAIQETRVATEALNPLNVANWEARAYVYSSIAGLAKDGNDWAAKAYGNAIQLDSTNPALRIALGGIAYAKEDFLSAANQFRQAAALKPDYANAHYNFAQSLVKLKSYADAKKELEIVKQLLPKDSKDLEKVAQEIKSIDEMLASVAGTTDERPTVAQLQNPSTSTTAATQEPLTKPGETTKPVVTPVEDVKITNTGTVEPTPTPTPIQEN